MDIKMRSVDRKFTNKFGLEQLLSIYYSEGSEDYRPFMAGDDPSKSLYDGVIFEDKDSDRWMYKVRGSRTYLLYFEDRFIELKMNYSDEGSLKEGLSITNYYFKSIKPLFPKEKLMIIKRTKYDIPHIKDGKIPYDLDYLEHIDREEIKQYFKKFIYNQSMENLEATKKRRKLHDAKIVLNFDW
ncbi:MAG: Unknown protein [uncultured Sulfurovum sp.]|uniref:Uncharacterized protein n=1 Tax=uncultured Sulfurovum sp. TaxID=269237 RepID=A0A6S6T9E2_9BACT|nr:MAG: Unknown protein [uncultured Sulfurovum sp.]